MRRRARGGVQSQLLRLFRAISVHDIRRGTALLDGAPALASTPLAAGANRLDPSRFFFEAIKHYAYAGDTALHLAAAARALEVVALLLEMGASPRARNRRGAEPLHYACDGGPPDVATQAQLVEFLISCGADANAHDNSGVTALHRATRSRSPGAVGALLAAGADVHLLTRSGSSPLHLAVQDTGKSGSGSDEARSAQAEILRLLCVHGAHPDDRTAAGKTVLECARADWIRQLLLKAKAE